MRLTAFAPLALLFACAGTDISAAQQPAAAKVPVSPAFRAAIKAGTRTPDGKPGPAYWQQRANYRIDAQVDPKTALLQGEETIRYLNASPDTLPGLVLHLYQNLFKPGAARTEPTPVTPGITLEKVTVGGKEAREVKTPGQAAGAGAGYQIQGTLMLLRLPQRLKPHDSTTVTISWHYTVPPGSDATRTKHIGSQLYLVAQWYPQIAVYDDVHGWHTGQYLGTGEFYLEYGNFDVSLTLPEGYVIGATGELQNADEVLTDGARARLRQAASSDAVVHIITEDNITANTATERVPGAELTWRFLASNVRDFAFAASNRYLWDATRAVVPDPTSTARTKNILVNAFYRPEARNWREAARYSKHSVQFHASHWHPYIYPQITSAEGPEGGMEYPMIVFVEEYENPRELYDVITHEIGHEWFPMMVGSDEKEYAWMDEGVNTYVEQFANKDFYPDFVPFQTDIERYLSIAGSEEETEMMRGADLFPSGEAYAIAAYSKPAVALHTLASIIGEDMLQQSLQEYTNRWHLKHPMPLDFFHTVESVTGRNLDWFWYPWWYTTATLDQAITDVRTSTSGSTTTASITIENIGDLPAPVNLLITTSAGTQTITVPATVWATGQKRSVQNVELKGTLQSVAIDPDSQLPDVDRSNNVWPRPAVPASK
jgi:hypothetical protein